MSLLNAVTPFTATGSSSNGGSVTLPAGTNRKLLVGFTAETTSTITALTYNGTAFLSNLCIESESAATLGNKSSVYWYDVPDVLGAGNYDLRWNQSTSSTARRCYCAVLVGAVTGEPAWEGGTFLDGVGTGMSFNLTSVTAGAFVFAVYQMSASGVSVTWGADVAERYDEALSAYRSSQADADDVAAGTKTISTTSSASDAGYRQTVVGVAVEAASLAPTITVQPVADTVILSNETSASFSVTATGTGTLLYDWELEDGVGSGVYANLANGNGATWTGQASASCSATLTAKTLTGRRVRCNVTDDNGTTTSSAVALTIWDGPQLTTFPATDGDGESTATLTCDYVTGVGEAIEVRIPLSDGDVAVTVTTT
jgi:hypothetical protein